MNLRTPNRIAQKFAVIALLSVTIAFQGCSQLKELAGQALMNNIKNMTFKLASVTGFRVGGIDISRIRSASDLSLMDGMKLAGMVSSKSIPAEFILNVSGKNPNDGTAGTKATDVTLKSFDWQLLVDDQRTIGGNIASPITITAKNALNNIPLSVNLDLYKFFGDKGYDKIIELALAIGGANGSPTRLKLDALPTISAPLVGDVVYPNRITIMDKEYK